MTKIIFPAFAACLFLGFALLSCGLQDIPYISRVMDPVHTGLDGTSDIRLPSSSEYGFGSTDPFTRFVIFYRIYLSNNSHAADTVDTSQDRIAINSQLNSDYIAASHWTDPTNTRVNTAGVHNFFVNTRGFFSLELEGVSIANVLGRGSLGRNLSLDFPDIPGQAPRLLLDYGTPNARYYDLRRAGGRPHFDFEPVPNIDGALPFFNHDELLYGPDTIRDREINVDVALQTTGQMEHSYVMMYIAAMGASGVPPIPVFSQPTFLGIFRLPSPF